MLGRLSYNHAFTTGVHDEKNINYIYLVVHDEKTLNDEKTLIMTKL